MEKPLNHKLRKEAVIFALGAILLGVAIPSCVTVYETINNRDFSDQYNPAERYMHPEYSIYMKSPDDVRLYFRFFPRELAFFEIDSDSIPKARARLFFRITNSYSGTQIIDSLTKNFVLKGKPRSHFIGFVPLQFPSEGKYIIEVFLSDINVNKTISTVLEYNHKPRSNPNSYMLLSQHGNPLFHNFFSVTDSFRIRTEMFDSKKMRVSYYKPESIIPPPPDIDKEMVLDATTIDSTWIIENPDTVIVTLSKKGIYQFTNNNELIGKSAICFQENFPYLKTSEELLRPLSYLCTAKEFRKMLEMQNAKHALDTFWIKATNDIDKSRELIRVFYNRVQLANYFFTDYKEGWLSDRGMIYIICGAPAITRITDEGEYWFYGKGSDATTKFFFSRLDHPVFGSTYVLDRSDLYSRMWYTAITTWRDGRVFSLNP